MWLEAVRARLKGLRARAPPQSAKLDGDLKSARTELTAATNQAQEANRQWQAAETALRDAERKREQLVATAQIAITQSSDLKQALNATKAQVAK